MRIFETHKIAQELGRVISRNFVNYVKVPVKGGQYLLFTGRNYRQYVATEHLVYDPSYLYHIPLIENKTI